MPRPDRQYSRSPAPSQPVELTIDKLVPGGDGLARLDGKVYFVPFVLPGEKVRARIIESKKDFARAVAVEILEPSPERAVPPCAVFGRCGGCDWQHIDYPAQLRHKVALAEDALRRIGGVSFPGLAIEGGKPWGYRNRVQIHRRPGGGAGFLARGSHDLVSVAGCPVAHSALAPLFAALPEKPGPAGPDGERRAPQRHPAWSHPLPDGSGDFVAAQETGWQSDREIAVPLLGKTIRFDLRCFFQSNLEMTARLIPYALEGLAGEEALDLYCGVGLFGAFLADRFARVLAVEENPISLGHAQRNIGDTHTFLPGRVEDLLSAVRGPLAEANPQAIVVDPPRTGLDKAVCDFLIAKRPAHLVYVSCNPVTLARDLKLLLAAGFSLADLRLFDFYPQTAHVEAVAKLSWGKELPDNHPAQRREMDS